jgi:hypothetical protein
MRRQLRPFYSPAQLADLYGRTYDHTRWPDHVERVAHTAAVLDRLADEMNAESVADLSCGDGAIVGGSRHAWRRRILGDIATTGMPIEKAIADLEPVDVFVCSETLEHVENPDGLLAAIQSKARGLLMTTPADEADDSNPEHYWSWGVEDLRAMLTAAGWTHCAVELFTPASVDMYTFQIWTCRR